MSLQAILFFAILKCINKRKVKGDQCKKFMLKKSKCALKVKSLFLCNSSTSTKTHKQLYDFRTWKEKAIKNPVKLNKKGTVPIASSNVLPSHLHSLIEVGCLFCQKYSFGNLI